MNNVVATTVLASATLSTVRIGAGVYETAIKVAGEIDVIATVRGVERAREMHSNAVGYVSGHNRSEWNPLPRAAREACDRAVAAR